MSKNGKFGLENSFKALKLKAPVDIKKQNTGYRDFINPEAVFTYFSKSKRITFFKTAGYKICRFCF